MRQTNLVEFGFIPKAERHVRIKISLQIKIERATVPTLWVRLCERIT